MASIGWGTPSNDEFLKLRKEAPITITPTQSKDVTPVDFYNSLRDEQKKHYMNSVSDEALMASIEMDKRKAEFMNSVSDEALMASIRNDMPNEESRPPMGALEYLRKHAESKGVEFKGPEWKKNLDATLIALAPFADKAMRMGSGIPDDLVKIAKGDFDINDRLIREAYHLEFSPYYAGVESIEDVKKSIQEKAKLQVLNYGSKERAIAQEISERGTSFMGTVFGKGAQIVGQAGEMFVPGGLATKFAVGAGTEAAARYAEHANAKVDYDENGNPVILDGDSTGKAAKEALIGGSVQSGIELLGGKVLGKAWGATGGKLLGKAAETAVGQKVAENSIVKGVGKITNWLKTPLEITGWSGMPGEIGEEFMQGATDAYFGLNTTDAEERGTTAGGRFKEFAGDFFKGENLADLAGSMLLMQAIGGGSAYLQKRHTNKQLNKIITEKIGGVSENVLKKLSPEEKARIIEAHYSGLSADEAAAIINKGAGALDKFMIEKQTEATKSAKGRAMLAEMNPEAADAIRAARREGKDISRKMIRDLGLSEKVLGDVETRNKFGDALLEDGRKLAAKNAAKMDGQHEMALRQEIGSLTQDTSEAQRIYDRIVMKLKDASVLDDPYQREQLVMQAAEAAYAEDQARRVGGARQRARMAEKADHEARIAEAEAQAAEQAEAERARQEELVLRQEHDDNERALARENLRFRRGVIAAERASQAEYDAMLLKREEDMRKAFEKKRLAEERAKEEARLAEERAKEEARLAEERAKTKAGQEERAKRKKELAEYEAQGRLRIQREIEEERAPRIIDVTQVPIENAPDYKNRVEEWPEYAAWIKRNGLKDSDKNWNKFVAKNDLDPNLKADRGRNAKGGSPNETRTDEAPAKSEQAARVTPPAGEAARPLEAGKAPPKVGGEVEAPKTAAEASTSASTETQASLPPTTTEGAGGDSRVSIAVIAPTKPKTVKEGKAFVSSNIGKQYTDGKKTYEITGLTKDGEVSVKVTDKIGKSSETTLKLSGTLNNIFGTKKTSAVWSKVKTSDPEQNSPNRTKTTAETPKAEQKVPKAEVANKKTASEAEKAEVKRNESGRKAEVKKPKSESAPTITPSEAMKKLGTLGAADVDTLTKAMHREERLGHTERANMIRVLRDYKRGVGTNSNPQSDETSGGKYRASVEAAKPLDDPAFVAWAKKRGVAPTTQKRNEYDKAMADTLTNRLSRWIKGVSVEWVNFITPEEGGDVRHSIVSDKDTLSKLESGNTVKVYRAMQLIDGKLYPPMAARVKGDLVDPTELGVWYKADEHPELAIPVIDKKTGIQKVDKKTGRPMFAFKLDKANGASIEAAYNPYWHTSRTPLNDQFSSASKRPNIVIVEVEVPASELTSDYRAEKAKDSVGEKDWHSGPVSSWLAEYGDRRKVILSRYNKVVRVVPDAEVAMEIKNMLSGTDISIPEGVITPSLREELKRLDVDISKEPRSAYSWKALTKNGRGFLAPQIAAAPFSSGTTTKAMIEAGRTSVRNAGGKDTEQGLVLNIPAFGDVVVIGKSGLKHGLRPYIGDTPYGKLDNPDNANILPVVGDILKHSVPINELRPRKDSTAEGATVLIGAAFSEKGELIPVVSIVHHLKNTNFTPPVAIFPLHSINTKGRLSHAFDTQNTENALTEISLSDLISLVKDDIPLFSKDVYAHFKENRPADSNFDNLRYLHDGERIVGSYNRATGEVKLAKGASVETVLHELGWHAARHWAEVNADSDPKAANLLKQMKKYAESAPKEIKDAVRDVYGDLDADTLLDEIGAARFTKEQSGKIAEALATKEGAAWYQKVWNKVVDFFKNFLTKIGYNRVDLDGIENMSPEVFGDFLADVMMSGKQLGERTAFSMEAPKGLAAKWTNNLSDYKAPIAELEKRLTGSSNNIYYLARTLEGQAQRGKNRAERAIKRVEKILGEDISPELLAQYMQLKAYEERNAKIERRNGKADASGMTPEDARAIEKTIKDSGVDEAIFEEAAQILWDLQTEGLQARVDAGLLDQETANKWMTDEPHHIPWKDAVDPDSGEYVGRRMGASEFDTAEGRKTAASGDPITWMLQEYQDAMTRAAQNRLRSSIANLTRLNGDVGTIYDGIQTDSKGKRSFIKYPKGGGKAKVLSIPEGVKIESTVKNDGGMKNVLTFKESGETKYLVLNGALGEAVAGAVTGRTLARPIPYLGAINRFSSATATTFSWAFAAKNYKRDTVDVRNNFIADFGWKKGNILVASAEKFAWTHIKELSRYAATGELSLDEKGNPTTEFAKLVLEYEDAGGLMSGNAVQSYDHIEKQIKADFRFGKNRVRSLAKGAADLYMAVPKISELLTRIGAFAALRKDGMSAKDAVMWARESTFDFDKKGAFAPVLNSLWLFSNANIQAAHRQLRGLIKSKNGWKVAADMAVVGFVMHIVNEMLNADDDDEDEKEGLGIDKDISEYDRQHYIFLRFGQKMYRTPVNLGPYGFARYIGDVTARMMTGDISIGEAAKNLGVSAAEIGASSSGVPINMGAVIQTGFPSLTQGIVQGLSGKNFAGFDLYKNKHPQNKTPDSHYGKRTTAPAYKWVAEKLNEITGGNEAKPGWIDIRPETVELVVENIGKSALRDITDLSRIPKAFIVDDKDIDGNESRYWDAKAVYDQDKHELKNRSDLKGEERRAYLKEHPWLYSAGKPGVTRIDNIVKRIEKLRDIEESDRATEERKAEAKAMRRKLQARVMKIMEGK